MRVIISPTQSQIIGVITQTNSKMQRYRSSNPSKDQKRKHPPTKNKQNTVSDAVFLIQNQNDVLRMKNSESNLKIKELKQQLQVYTDSIALHERDIENIRGNISGTAYQEDVEIQNEKTLLVERLTLLKSNEDIVMRKIKEAREATIFEQGKVGEIMNDRKGIEMEILSLKAQNEGTKIVLQNIEDQNEQLRAENQVLIGKRKIFEPKEKEISIEIEERIRFIKNQQQILRNLKKTETTKLFCSSLSLIYYNKLRSHFSKLERYSLLRKMAQKKVVQLSLIRKKYLLTIKQTVLEKFRATFRPLAEQQTAKRIISETHKRRVKSIIWRKWRTATKNSEFETTRKFEFQNTLDLISQSFVKTNLYAAFNILKYFKNNPFHQRSVIRIDNIWSTFTKRCKVLFFSALRIADNKHEISKEIESSSKEQSELLVTSLYFTAWVQMTKAHKIENLNLQRRYFKELRKLPALSRRRKLGEMLTVTNEKISSLDYMSKSFCQLRQQTTVTQLESLEVEVVEFKEKRQTIEEELQEMRSDRKALYQELSLLKVSKYLKTKMQKAFDVWRLRKQQSKVILTIINMIESKKSFDKNFGFAKILKKRFAMLKKSINQKIQSCEFSYNYLLDQNKHIKEVLDVKQHELEKTKFTNILKKICRNEKEMKLKYFYKFMRSGFKFWQFRKLSHKVDKMTQKKVKMVFMWHLKRDMLAEKEENRIQSFVEGKQHLMNTRLLKKAFKSFEVTKKKNGRLKRVMGGIFERNLELDFYVAFGKIRNEEHLYFRGLIQDDIDEGQGQIDQINAETVKQEETIVILKERLSYKEDTLAERKVLGLFNFFVKNIKTRYGSYLQLWNNKVKRENRVTEFAQILERKSRIMLKGKFMSSINKKNEDFTLIELQQKSDKFQSQYENLARNQEKFLQENEKEIVRMKSENEVFRQEGEIKEKKTDYMTKLKLKSHAKAWGKKMLRFCFKNWKVQTDKFTDTWTGVDNSLSTRVLRQTFTYIAKEMKEQLFKQRIRNNLDRIYTKTFQFNAGLGFRTWKYVLFDKQIMLWSEEERKQMKKFESLEKKHNYAVDRHDGQVTYRQYDPKIRALWNKWRQYTQNKINNNIKLKQLNTWISRGYGSQFLRLIKKKATKKLALKAKINNFIKKCEEKRVRAFLEYTHQNKFRKQSLNLLFVNKFCPFMIHKTYEEVFSKIVNYGNSQQVISKTDKTMRIQTVIETFERKRKAILSQNMIKWRRNQYEIRIAKNLLKRLTKNAMNWRVKDLFYAWKLENEAKRVKQMHEEEGQVKKRKIEINRLKMFLEEFKKQKGLLLQDDGGKFVLSPRFQQKKDEQIKKDNNLRYKFISRLILSMNGYSAPVKTWNNLRTYTKLREKFKKCALFTRNCLRKPDMYSAFKTWHSASANFNKMFDTMERKGLIKILNRQKDKMEMEYSKKVNLQEKIQDQMRSHKVLSYHEERKEKLAVCLLFKNVRKIKMYAMLAWKDRVRELKDAELESLQYQGNTKITYLQEQINQLEYSERELRQNNQKLEEAVRQAIDIAEMVKRITQERDMLSKTILDKQLTCESLQEENQELNAKLFQAQKEAMNLLILSGEKM